MKNELITKDSEIVSSFCKTLDRMVANVEKVAESCKPALNGERFLTDKELSDRLKVSRRTLQDYRDNGLLPYYRLGGKVLYKESDAEKILKDNYG
ncbi:MAG: helix-turn-helix domain-containing protein [Alistipes sp.]|nr:helix-turn-helix domain-containing protein [Alistipes sp.]